MSKGLFPVFGIHNLIQSAATTSEKQQSGNVAQAFSGLLQHLLGNMTPQSMPAHVNAGQSAHGDTTPSTGDSGAGNQAQTAPFGKQASPNEHSGDSLEENSRNDDAMMPAPATDTGVLSWMPQPGLFSDSKPAQGGGHGHSGAALLIDRAPVPKPDSLSDDIAPVSPQLQGMVPDDVAAHAVASLETNREISNHTPFIDAVKHAFNGTPTAPMSEDKPPHGSPAATGMAPNAVGATSTSTKLAPDAALPGLRRVPSGVIAPLSIGDNTPPAASSVLPSVPAASRTPDASSVMPSFLGPVVAAGQEVSAPSVSGAVEMLANRSLSPSSVPAETTVTALIARQLQPAPVPEEMPAAISVMRHPQQWVNVSWDGSSLPASGNAENAGIHLGRDLTGAQRRDPLTLSWLPRNPVAAPPIELPGMAATTGGLMPSMISGTSTPVEVIPAHAPVDELPSLPSPGQPVANNGNSSPSLFAAMHMAANRAADQVSAPMTEKTVDIPAPSPEPVGRPVDRESIAITTRPIVASPQLAMPSSSAGEADGVTNAGAERQHLMTVPGQAGVATADVKIPTISADVGPEPAAGRTIVPGTIHAANSELSAPSGGEKSASAPMPAMSISRQPVSDDQPHESTTGEKSQQPVHQGHTQAVNRPEVDGPISRTLSQTPIASIQETSEPVLKIGAPPELDADPTLPETKTGAVLDASVLETTVAGTGGESTSADRDGKSPELQAAEVAQKVRSQSVPDEQSFIRQVTAHADTATSGGSMPASSHGQAELEAKIEPRLVIEQIATRLKVEQRGDIRELTVQLDPPELGTVHVKVSAMPSGEMVAEFETPHAAIRDLLESRLGQLRETLSQSGVQVDQCTVSLDMQMRQGERQAAAMGARPGGHGGRRAENGREGDNDSERNRSGGRRKTELTVLDYFA